MANETPAPLSDAEIAVWRASWEHYRHDPMPDVSGMLQVFVDGVLGPMPTILTTDNKAVVLDPRAIIRGEGGDIIYTPRSYPLDTHTRAMREWLVDHPRWGEE